VGWGVAGRAPLRALACLCARTKERVCLCVFVSAAVLTPLLLGGVVEAGGEREGVCTCV
jgi:hypothetical protein